MHIGSRLPPTKAERKLAADRGAFEAQAKFPVREWAVLSPEHLAATRAQLGSAAVRLPKARQGATDRRPLSADELRDARAAATYGGGT